MGTAASFFLALTNAMGWINSQVKLKPLILFAAQTGAMSATNPTDAAPPPTAQNTIGDGATADLLGNWTPILGAIRCDGYRQISLSLEVFGSSGAVSATFQPYFWDGVRWCASADTITVTNSQTTSNPQARQRHDIVIENDFGFVLMLTAISGSGATAAAYACLRDPIIAVK